MATLARCALVIQDDRGDIVNGASITVRSEATGSLVSLYSDRAGATPIGNPFTADNGADVAFHVAGGSYRVLAETDDVWQEIRYLPVGTAAEHDAEDFVAIANGRVKLSENTTYNVPADFATVDLALAHLYEDADGGGHEVTIQFADATDYVVSSYLRPFVGIPKLSINGNASNKRAVKLTPSADFVFQSQEPRSTVIYIENMEIDYTDCPFGAIGVFQHGDIVLNNIYWTGGAGLGASNTMTQQTVGNIIFYGEHTIEDTGTINILFASGDNGFTTIEPGTDVIFVGSQTVSGVFQAYSGGVIRGVGADFTGGGSVAGFKALLTSGGIVELLSATGTIPGTAISNDGSGTFKHPNGAIEDGQWHTLAASAVQVTAPTDTNENTVLTQAIPANSMGPNGGFRVKATWGCTNNANSKVLRAKFNGTEYDYADAASLPGIYTAVGVQNRNATNSQSNAFDATYQGHSPRTSSHDTTASQNLTLTVQKATGADAVQLNSYIIETMYRS